MEQEKWMKSTTGTGRGCSFNRLIGLDFMDGQSGIWTEEWQKYGLSIQGEVTVFK